MADLVDTHCHLADPRLHGDLEAVLARASEAGVVKIVSVGAIGPIEIDRLTVEIAEHHDNVFAAVGVHPHDAKDCTADRIAELRELAQSKKVVAIGESGLDFHYLHSPRDAQEASLCRHLDLAGELNLPIVIHCRDAEARLVEILRERGVPPAGGVIHCFTGDADSAVQFLELGLFISFSGIVTFKNARAVREAARVVRDDSLMIETDAPYLAPEPYRGKRNEPAYVRHTFEVLAEVRGADPDVLSVRIAANAARLFRLPA
ncbi:MAG TPA: TatD family hydrolase [Candidatus Binataceae bacterium]|nr:TatD family hydrolase [Candidatus Binataceae bacterium]